MKRPGIDNEREFDWGRTSQNYADYRPGYPERFYEVLHALGFGTKGQKILDLGTGTGVLARAFSRRGAVVRGIDIAANQIEQARRLADEEGLDVAFEVCASEQMEAADGSLDIVSAGQSWLYFDRSEVIPRVLRALKPDGRLVMTTLGWLPHKDPIARMSDDLVLQHNPDWKGAHYPGTVGRLPDSLAAHFDLATFHVMHEAIPFTRESWRGRYLACRGIGASLDEEAVRAFDESHDRMLREQADDTFTILHEMAVHAYARKGRIVSSD